jgi:hypothetical protein
MSKLASPVVVSCFNKVYRNQYASQSYKYGTSRELAARGDVVLFLFVLSASLLVVIGKSANAVSVFTELSTSKFQTLFYCINILEVKIS